MPDERWVSVSDAARLEGEAGRAVNKSSISRFLGNNPDVSVRRDGAGRVAQVEYGSLARARGASLNVKDSHDLRAEAVEPARPVQAPANAAASTATDRIRTANAERVELDLAERKGELLSRAAVNSAIEAAGAAFVQGLERRRSPLAQAITGLTDARSTELELKASDRTLLEALVSDLSKALPGAETAAEA